MENEQLPTNQIPNSLDKEFETISSLPPEQQKSIFKIFRDANIQNNLKIKQLENEVRKRDKAIEVFATAGIDIRDLHTLQEVSEVLNMKPEEAIYLLENNEEEFLKMLFRHYKILIAEKKRLLSDMQVDINGDKINNKLKEIRTALREYRDLGNLSPEKIKAFPLVVDKFEATHELLISWQTVDADVKSFNEAITHSIIHYAVKHLKKQAMDAQNIVYNPEEEIRKQKAKQDEIDKKKLEEEKKTMEQTNTTTQVASKQVELEKKLDDIKTDNGVIKNMLSTIGSGVSGILGGKNEGEDDNDKPGIKGRPAKKF